MAERANPFAVMKQYLAAMNKRMDEILARTNSLAEEIRRLPEQEASERSKLSERFDSERAELTNRFEGLTSQVTEHQNQLTHTVEQLRQQLEEFRTSTANKDELQAIMRTLREEIAPLQEQKLERSEFHDFVEKNNASMKEVFEELTGGQSFADFASSEAAMEPPRLQQESTLPAEGMPPSETAYTESPPPEPRREEKKKKKWL